jgi:hypothetical protein
MATTIRKATPADVHVILDFIRALAIYEREPDAVSATEEGLLRDGFGHNPFYFCMIAEHEGAPAGFALYFFNCPRLQWEVLDWNTPAIDFYRAMGAEFLDEWRNVRVSGDALARLAEAPARDNIEIESDGPGLAGSRP